MTGIRGIRPVLPWSDIDPDNGSVGVDVELEDGRAYSFSVATARSALVTMRRFHEPCFVSLPPAIIVERLDSETLQATFNTLFAIEDDSLLRHYQLRLLHGIGGWQNCLFAGCTILALPSFRDRIPVIVGEVTTLTGPGELIDVVVTELGIAINPRRQDLIDATKSSKLPIRSIEEIQREVFQICGGRPQKPKLTDRPVAVVKWVDGTVLDTVWQVAQT
jgi:hypothetical protein